MCLSLEFILSCSGVLAFPSPFNWKLFSHCLNLQKQTRCSYLEKFLCELFFLYIFQNYVVNGQMKMKNRRFGENMSHSRKRSISSLCKQECLCTVRHSQIFSLLIFIFPYLPVQLHRLINKEVNIKE